MRLRSKPVSGPWAAAAVVAAAVVGAMVWARRFAVLAVVFGLGLLLAPVALAGGQTSVLVTSPSSAEAAALYASDARYQRLEELLGPPGKGDRERPLSLDSSVGTRQINVAWMALDLTPARIDRVFPGDDPATIWIHTASEVPSTYRGLWHRAAKPAELAALFKELGLMGRPDNAEGGTAIFPRSWEDEATADRGAPLPEVPVTTAGASSTSAPGGAGVYERLDHWWWAFPGLAVGAALTLAALRFPGGRREHRRRQQLLDG